MACANLANSHQREQNNRLHVRVLQNNVDAVKKLLQNGADASLTTSTGDTLLQIAASQKNHQLVQTLLKYSSRESVKKFINAKNVEDENSALHIAASSGCTESVRHLLSYGANFEIINKNGKQPIDLATKEAVKTLLMGAKEDSQLAAEGKWEMIQARLRHYSNENLYAMACTRNNDGMTALQMAVIKNHCNTVHKMIELRVDRLNLFVHGSSAIRDEEASVNEFVEHANFIYEHRAWFTMKWEEVNTINNEEMAKKIALVLLAAHSVVKIAEREFKPKNGEPYEQPSFLAAVEETLEVLQFQPEHITCNARQVTSFCGHEARYYKMLLATADENKHYDDSERQKKIMSYMLILQIVTIRAVAVFLYEMFTAKLSIAARIGDFRVCEMCIDQPFIDPDIVDINLRTPLHYAAEKGKTNLVKKLIMKGANITYRSNTNLETALHLAARNGHVESVRLLLQYIEDPLELRTFIDMKTSDKSWTAIHFAAKTGRLDVLKCLLEYGAAFDLQDRHGRTPWGLSNDISVTEFLERIIEFYFMSRNGDVDLFNKLRALQKDEILACVKARTSNGHTMKVAAKSRGHQDIVLELSKITAEVTPAAVPPRPMVHDMNYDWGTDDIYHRLMQTLNRFDT
ncbi:ankyrin-3-like [Phymastichus coffea]|uniref:ankyrin-3-like n=1 Tax=Phymastichus coffea TaxID=108790 RepID=UPI00273AF9A6|nr:ankyrin-3-like [Phymastichus coffea]